MGKRKKFALIYDVNGNQQLPSFTALNPNFRELILSNQKVRDGKAYISVNVAEWQKMESATTVILEALNLLNWEWAFMLAIIKGDYRRFLKMFTALRQSMRKSISSLFAEVAALKAFLCSRRRSFYLQCTPSTITADMKADLKKSSVFGDFLFDDDVLSRVLSEARVRKQDQRDSRHQTSLTNLVKSNRQVVSIASRSFTRGTGAG